MQIKQVNKFLSTDVKEDLKQQKKKKGRLIRNRINSKKNPAPANVAQTRKEDISHGVKRVLAGFCLVG